MKPSIYQLPILLLLFLLPCNEDPDEELLLVRYQDDIFENCTKTADLTYGNNNTLLGTNVDLKLDFFEPTGDILAERPLVIFAHGGYFTQGLRNEFDSICTRLAKKGYASATIDYRLWEGGIPLDTLDLISVEVRAMGDLKAAIRFFKADAAGADQFRIDPNKIIIGGFSSGAWMALHAAYLSDLSKVPSFVADTILANGGIDGNSGNPTQSSTVAGVISLSGSLLSAELIAAGDAPFLAVHGAADLIMPYCTGPQRDQLETEGMQLDGPCVYHPKAMNLGIPAVLKRIDNGNHDSPFGNATYSDTEAEIFDFLYDLVRE